MSKLVVLKHLTSENAESPEFRYLFSYCVNRARKAFEVETIAWREGSGEPLLPAADYVLVLGKENLFFTAETLIHMTNALNTRVSAVLPNSISKFKVTGESPIYTIRGYELIEKRIFNEFHKPFELNDSHLPISLFSADSFREVLNRTSVEEVLTDKELFKNLRLGNRTTHAGVFHQFIDYYGEIREDILPYIPEGTEEILEIGCGRGLTGEFLQNKLGCRVTGVELNSDIASDARSHISRVICGDIQELDIEEKYDVVLATELFEHLNYPEDFLLKMKSVLRPGGRIVLSVPNVGHYSVVEDLLAGRWDYVPIGLLCYTHFRFFTRRTLEDWVERSGITSYEITPQKTELPARFGKLSSLFETDMDSLETKGFYVIIKT